MYGFRKDTPRLFTQGDLLEVLRARQKQIESEVNQLSDDYIEDVNEKELANSFNEKYLLVTPRLEEDQNRWSQLEPENMTMRASESAVYAQLYNQIPSHVVDGQRLTVLIPFEGSAELFKFKPRLQALITPAGRIVGTEIEMVFEDAPLNLTSMQNSLKSNVSSINEFLKWVANDVTQFNSSIENIVIAEVSKKRLLKQQRNQLASNLGIPIRRRETPPITPPVLRKKFELPQVVRVADDPTLDLTVYNHILKVCADMARIMEYSPKAFQTLEEEDLRYHFLVQLNGWYEGQATGETFNLSGKTDIIVKTAAGNLFIAECKIWTGEKAFSEAINQLLGYVSWRDTKTAIILFNKKNKNFTEVLKKMDETVRNHPNYVQSVETAQTSQTERRYHFANKQDASKHFLLTTLAFNVIQTEADQTN